MSIFIATDSAGRIIATGHGFKRGERRMFWTLAAIPGITVTVY